MHSNCCISNFRKTYLILPNLNWLHILWYLFVSIRQADRFTYKQIQLHSYRKTSIFISLLPNLPIKGINLDY